MVGVNVITAVRSGPTGADGDQDATYFVAGVTERGPVDKAVVLYSLGDYIAVFGGRVTYGALYDDLRTHFEEGGIRAVVSRVVGASASLGTLTLKDTNTGTAQNTLRIDAQWPGARSTGITVAVTAGSSTGLFTITIYFDGVQVEQFADLQSPADAQNQLAASLYVRGTDLGSVTVAPANNPATVVATALSAGNDDRTTIVAATYLAALARFTETAVDKSGQPVLLGSGQVSIPGQPATAVAAGLAAHGQLRHRNAVSSNPVGTSAATAQSNAATIISAIGVAGGLEYSGIVFPGIKIPDAGNVVRTITAEGYIAAKRAVAIQSAGPERAPIGKISQASFVLAPEILLDRTTSDALDTSHIIPIRSIRGGTRIMGWRSLSSDPTGIYKLLKVRDLLNSIQIDCTRDLEDLLGETIDGDGHLASKIQAAMIGRLDPIAKRGGLYPRNGDPGWSVDVGPAVNTDVLAAQDIEAVVLGVRPSPTVELFYLTLITAALSANL